MDFENAEQMEAWLKLQPEPVKLAFASRNALRIFLPPIVGESPGTEVLVHLRLLRFLITSCIAVHNHTIETVGALSNSIEHAESERELVYYVRSVDKYYQKQTHLAFVHRFAASIRSHISDPFLASRSAVEALGFLEALYSSPFTTAPGSDSEEEEAGRATKTLREVGQAVAERAVLWDANFLKNLVDGERSLVSVFERTLWEDSSPNGFTENSKRMEAFFSADPETWGFWHRWLDGMRNGQPMDWELQRQIALIPDEIWRDGPEVVAEKIREIEARFELKQPNGNQEPVKVDAKVKAQVAAKILENRDAVALNIPPLLEQIAEYRELVRCSNSLDEEFKKNCLAFLDSLSENAQALLTSLPAQDSEHPQTQAEEAAGYMMRLWGDLKREGARYISTENVAKTAIPTSIILLCAGIGTIGGAPGVAAGAWVGKLKTGAAKPDKVADGILESGADGK